MRKCGEEKCQEFCVKKNYYSNIFIIKFNISFRKPKCEIFRVAEKEGFLTPDKFDEKSKHMAEKDAMRKERNLDGEDKNKLVISFVLQIVINCLRANISSFFYTRKLSMNNLTAHDSKKKNNKVTVLCGLRILQGFPAMILPLLLFLF